MKRVISLLLLTAFWLLASAQEYEYSVRYIRDHLLYQNRDEVNIIDVDLEWPEATDGAEMLPLHAFLIEQLFNFRGTEIGTAYDAFLSAYGSAVTTQFASAPDDRKTNYIEVSLKQKGHERGRFVSYELKMSCRPGAGSQLEARDRCFWLTYDLQSLQPLRRNDLLRVSKMDYAFGNVFLMMPVLVGDIYTMLPIKDACIVSGNVLLLCQSTEAGAKKTDLEEIMMTPEELGSYLSKSGKSLLKPTKASVTPHAFRTEATLDGEPVCEKPDEQPCFPLADNSYKHYLSTVVHAPKSETDGKKHGSVGILVTIDKNGETRHVRVVKPLSPAYDREAVRATMSLPRWIPARKEGNTVATQMMINVEF